MKVIEVKGKSTRGLRKVCVLLAPDMIKALDYLLRTRNSTSTFLFCRQSDKTPLDGCTAMRVITEECPGLKEPKRIRTREMRRYLATTTQILDMTAPELEMVADHMGHNVNIHTDVYRLQSSVLEKTKVARVLIAMENGNISKYQGKQLQQIVVEDIPDPIAYEDTWSKGVKRKHTGSSCDSNDDDGKDLPNNATTEGSKDVGLTEDLSDDDGLCSHDKVDLKKNDGGDAAKIQRRRWTEEENSLFRASIDMEMLKSTKSMPTGDVLQLLSTKLPGRTIAQIRTKIHNIISGKLKKY